MKLQLSHGIPLLTLAAAVQNVSAQVTVNPDFDTTDVDTAVEIFVLNNDSTDYGGIFLQSVDSSSDYGGTITQGSTGVIYTPAAGFSGQDTFTYVAADEDFSGTPQTGVVTVTVNEVTTPTFTLVPDVGVTTVNTPVEILVLENDTPGYGETVSLTSFSTTSDQGGTVTQGENGLIYTPPQDFEGEDTFTYDASDGFSYGGPVVVTVTVSQVPTEEEGSDIEGAVTGTNNKKTARMLDGLCSKIANEETAGFSELTLQNVTDLCNTTEDLNEAVSQITPEEVLLMRRMMSNISQGHSQRIYQHQDALRSGRSGLVVATHHNLMFQSYRGGSAGAEQDSRWGVFGSVHYDNAEHDQSLNESEYESSGYGVTMGVDYRLSSSLFVGGAVDLSSFEVDYASDAGETQSDVVNVTGFVTWFMDDYSFDLQLGYGNADFDTERNIAFTAIPEPAKGSTSSDQFNLSFQVDWAYSKDALTLRPFMRLDYMTTTIDGYTETGGSGWAMRVGEQDVDQITTGMGLDASYSMGFDWGVFVPGFKVSAVSESSSDYSPVTFQLAGVSSADGAFTLQPDSEDSLFYQYELSGVFGLKGGWSTFMSAQFIGGYDDYSAYVISCGARMEL